MNKSKFDKMPKNCIFIINTQYHNRWNIQLSYHFEKWLYLVTIIAIQFVRVEHLKIMLFIQSIVVIQEGCLSNFSLGRNASVTYKVQSPCRVLFGTLTQQIAGCIHLFNSAFIALTTMQCISNILQATLSVSWIQRPEKHHKIGFAP